MAVVATIGAEPARRDIELYAGEPVDFTEPVFNGVGALQDLTGWGLAAQVRASRDQPLLYTFTLAATAGGVRVTAPGADTTAWADWPVPSARWDLWLTPPGGQPSPLLVGWVRVHSPITHL